MYVVNNYGRTTEVPDDEAQYYIEKGDLRQATDSEIIEYQATRQQMNVAAAAGGTVYFQTVKSSADGYGMSRDHLKKKLADLGVHLSENYGGQKVGILYNYPYGVLSMRSDVRLIYTMFESDKIPDEWPDYLEMADEVLVPSKWCQKVFAESGIKSTVVPLGYSDTMFQPLKRGESDTFTFIHYDSFNYRKGFAEVFEAFNQEFSTDEPVRLILKTAQESAPVPIIPSQYPNIDVVTGSLPEKDLLALLARADCMVYPSRGEGFGITPLEAMATGLPAIVPNEHGISEYFNPDVMIEVKATDRCPALYTRFKGQDVGQMVVADVADLRKKMRWAYENQTEVRDIGARASEYVKQYSYANTAKALAEVIHRWENTEIAGRGDSKFLRVERV